MDIPSLFELMPFADHLGIDIVAAEDGHAEGRVDLREHYSSSPDRMIAHGAVPYALADTVGGAAVLSVVQDVAPTVDMRMDYLEPATEGGLRSTADVVRVGSGVATVDVTVTDGEGETVATARGVYKTGGGSGETAWADEEERERLEG